MCKFSIIIPVYNVEKYLRECIDSVLRQSYLDIEVILVDDGSSDNSPYICDQYAESDERIKVVHQSNGGVSKARNSGINISTGKYIMFLDADDLMVENSFTQINRILDDCDVDLVALSYNELTNDNILEYINILDKNEKNIIVDDIKKNYFKILALTKTIIFQVWSKVFVRSIIMDNKVFFDETLNSAEDCDFLFRYYIKSKNYCLSNLPVTNYRVDRNESVTRNLTDKTVMSNLIAFKKCFDLFNNLDIEVTSYFANKFANIISTIYRISDKEKINVIVEYIKSNKIVLSFTKGLKYSLAKKFWRFFGYYNGSLLLSKINHKRKR